MNIKAALVDRFGYTAQEADIMINDLEELSAEIMPIFEAWKVTGEENSNLEFHGYSIDSLRADYGMNFFAAVTTLDWIVKEPENAIPAIKQGIM